jgi:nucleoid-associated protein YgaU
LEVDMSIRRLVATAAAMAAIATALAALTPGLAEMAGALASPQHTADTRGPDALVLSTAGLSAWLVWAWGVLGLTLTAVSALPGLVGRTARLAARALLPAGARRTAAVVLGLGIGVAAPLLATGLPLGPPSVAAAAPGAGPVPDWPAIAEPATAQPATAQPLTADAVPDWPGSSPGPGEHVVVRGDCLWHIAVDRFLEERGRAPTDGEAATAAHAWWTANADVIGPDPDLLLPGQVLRAPGRP